VPLGLLYSTIGLTLGSVGAFLIARWLEEHYVKRWIPAEILQKFDFSDGTPGGPGGVHPLSLPGFPRTISASSGPEPHALQIIFPDQHVGRIPGTLLLTLQGAKVYKGDYYSTLIILGLCLVFVVALGTTGRRCTAGSGGSTARRRRRRKRLDRRLRLVPGRRPGSRFLGYPELDPAGKLAGEH